jgi:hypothetical protein
MVAKAVLIIVIVSALLVSGLMLLKIDSPVVTSLEQTPTQEPTSTNPPAPPSPTPRPTATPWLDAPYNSHVQPVMKPENTPTPTQVPGTATPPPTSTNPPSGPSPAYRDYLPSVWEMVSTATATISPDATPTIWLTPTAPTP